VKRVIPLNSAVWDQAEIDAVVAVLERHGNLRMGRRAKAFEQRVAALLGKRHGILLNSGSSALELGVQLLGLPEGSEVITVPLTFSTDVAALVRARLVPVFMDVEPGTYVVDVDAIVKAAYRFRGR